MALEVFFENINLFTPIFLGVGVALGIFLGLFLSKPRKHQVMKILPSDNRAYQFDILTENAFSIYCKGFEGLPDQRFIKFEPSMLVKVKKMFGKSQQIVRYLAREGTAYVQKAGDNVENIPFHKAVRTMVGETFYSQMPEEITEIFETSKVGVTVGLVTEALTPLDRKGNVMKSVSEEDLKREEDKQAASVFWSEKQLANRNQWIHNIAWIGFGFGVCMVVNLMMGWIKIV